MTAINIDSWNPLLAVGGAACVMGFSLSCCAKTQDQKTTAKLITFLGLSVLSVGAYQIYTESQSFSFPWSRNTAEEELRYYEAIRVPAEGNGYSELGKWFDKFIEKYTLKRENFLPLETATSKQILPSQLNQIAMWGHTPEKGHILAFRSKFFTKGGTSCNVAIEVLNKYRNSWNVQIKHTLDSDQKAMQDWISKVLPNIHKQFENFISGEQVCTNDSYACLQLA